MKILTICSLLITFLFACNHEEFYIKQVGIQASEYSLSFKTYEEGDNNPIARGITKTAFEEGDTLGIFAYVYSADSSIEDIRPNLMYNTALVKNATWEYSPLKFWPTDNQKEINFFAYYPYSENYEGMTVLTDSNDTGLPSFTYKVSEDISQQYDLMVASQTNPTYKQAVNLNFKHTLAKISFSVKGSKALQIDRIMIDGIYNEATLNFDSSSPDGFIWKDFNGDASFTASANDELIDSETIGNIMTDSGYLFMIPQDVNSKEVYVSITQPDEECLGSLTYKLNFPSEHKWEAGKSYNYSIEMSGGTPVLMPDYSNVTETANTYLLHPGKFIGNTYYIPIDERINHFWEEYSGVSDTSPYTITHKDGLTAEFLWTDNTEVNGGLRLSIIDENDAEFVRNTQKVTPAMEPNFITNGAKVALKIEFDDDIIHGNILVSIKRGSTVLWTWHLWVTDYDPDIMNFGEIHRYRDASGSDLWQTTYKNRYIMDRYLGAVDNTIEGHGGLNEYKRGFLGYQFGRNLPVMINGMSIVSFSG